MVMRVAAAMLLLNLAFGSETLLSKGKKSQATGPVDDVKSELAQVKDGAMKAWQPNGPDPADLQTARNKVYEVEKGLKVAKDTDYNRLLKLSAEVDDIRGLLEKTPEPLADYNRLMGDKLKEITPKEKHQAPLLDEAWKKKYEKSMPEEVQKKLKNSKFRDMLRMVTVSNGAHGIYGEDLIEMHDMNTDMAKLMEEASDVITMKGKLRHNAAKHGNDILAANEALLKAHKMKQHQEEQQTEKQEVQDFETELQEIALAKNSGHGLCLAGHNVPRLFHLGVPGAATSTMASDLHDHFNWQQQDFGQRMGWKGSNFFDKLFSSNPEQYLAPYGKCENEEFSPITADFSAEYLSNTLTPARISEFYGNSGEDLVFAVGLRDPLDRMHSGFHLGQKQGTCCRDLYVGEPHNRVFQEPTFHQHINAILREVDKDSSKLQKFAQAFMQKGNEEDDQLFKTVHQSLYSDSIELWLEKFHPSQFVFYPYKMYTNNRDVNKINPVLLDLGNKLKQELVVTDWKKSENVGNHTALLQELRPAEKERMRKFFFKHNKNLAVQLMFAMQKGASLAGYEGKNNDAEAIMAWLNQNW